MTNKMPIGWFDLEHDLRHSLRVGFPSAAITELTSDRGWLHVRVDDAHLDPIERKAIDRLIQRYVTESLSTCMCCGSSHGIDRPDRREITCDECETESCHG